MHFHFLSPQGRSQQKKKTLDMLTIPQRKVRKILTNIELPKIVSDLKLNFQLSNSTAQNQTVSKQSKPKLKPLTNSQQKSQLNQILDRFQKPVLVQQEEEQLNTNKKESILQKLPKKSILGLRLPSIKSDVRSSLRSNSESDTIERSEVSVVWNDDDLKIRGLLPQIQEEKPVQQFMELYKYRYESYPNMKQPIENIKVLRAARAYAKMNSHAWKKYFAGQEIEFGSEKNYNEGYNPFEDSNFSIYRDYIEKTKKVPRIIQETKSKNNIQKNQTEYRPQSKRNNFIIKSSVFKQ